MALAHPGVAHVHALHVAPEAERRDQVRVEARDAGAGARRRHQEVHVRGRPRPAWARQVFDRPPRRGARCPAKRADISSIVSRAARRR